MQHRHQVALHVGQLAFGYPDLVTALAGDDDPGRAFGILVEANQARGQPPHRPHEQEMQGDVDQSGREHRDGHRDQQQIAGKPVHRCAQRRLIDDGLDELRPAGSRPDHTDGLVAAFEHGLEGVDDRRPCRHRPHVDVVVDRRRQIGAGQQPPLLAHLDGNGMRANAGEDLPRQRIRHHAGGGRIQHQRGGVRGRQPIVQPVHPEVGDRRHIDQQSRDHHQRNGQQQQLARQAEPPRRQQPWLFRIRPWLC